MRKSNAAEPELLYQTFIVGLSHGERHSVSGLAADKELRGEPFPLEAMKECLLIKERPNAAIVISEQRETIVREDSDVKPMDIRAVIAGPCPEQGKGGGGPAQGINAPRRQREQRIWFCCGEMGHLIRD